MGAGFPPLPDLRRTPRKAPYPSYPLIRLRGPDVPMQIRGVKERDRPHRPSGPRGLQALWDNEGSAGQGRSAEKLPSLKRAHCRQAG